MISRLLLTGCVLLDQLFESLSAQVPKEESLDGYSCFFAVSEWWAFSTPFTQWFTKNYVMTAVPLGAALGVSPGHVTCLLEQSVARASGSAAHRLQGWLLFGDFSSRGWGNSGWNRAGGGVSRVLPHVGQGNYR